MSNATRDIKVIKAASSIYAPLQEAKAKASTKHYIGTAQVDNAGVADNPSTANAALYVKGVVKEYVDNSADANNGGINGDVFVTLETGEFTHFLNSGTNPVLVGTQPGTAIYFEDNQTVGLLNTAGSKGAKFLGWDIETGLPKVGVGPQYW